MEALKVKMSSKDQLLVFNYLDKGQKGYIDYQDFCNLSEERRLQIDPAQHMLDEYKAKGQLEYNYGPGKARSPSRKELERQKNNSSISNSAKPDEKSEVMKYLNTFNMNDLELISKSQIGRNK